MLSSKIKTSYCHALAGFKLSPHLPFWLGLGLVIFLAVLLRVELLDRFRVSYDEAIHLIWLQLLSAGYKPYSEVYITYPPLYPLTIQAVWNLWPSETAERWFSMGFVVFGALGTALIARRIRGNLAGVVAGGLILFSPLLLKPSRAILGEFHAVAWAVWAVWAILGYQEARNPRQKWLFLILSGLCLAASLLTKLLLPFMIGLILGVIAARHQQTLLAWRFKPFLLEAGGWSLALGLPAILLLFVVFDVRPLLQQVVDQRLLARTAYLAETERLPSAFEYTLGFVKEDPLLVISALLGLGVAWFYHRRYVALLAAWLLLAGLFLATHVPLRDKHFLVLIPGLSLLGSLAVAAWVQLLKDWATNRGGSRSHPNPGILYGVGGLFLWGWLCFGQVPAVLAYHWDDRTDLPTPTTEEQQMLAFINEVTRPEDCIITDNTPLLYWSGRMTPPELAEMSENRLISGGLSLAELIAISERDDCPVIAPVEHRIVQHLPGYIEWLSTHYLGRVYYQEVPLFFAKTEVEVQPETLLRADFDGKVIFHGYSLPGQAIAPGQKVPLRLVWERQASLEADYAVFVQVRDDAGNTLIQADYQPYQTLLPFSSWPAHEPLETLTWLALPDQTQAKDYRIYVGLYRPDTLERLPLQNDTSGENALILGPLVVR